MIESIKIVIAGEVVAAPRPRFRQWRAKDGRSGVAAYNPAFYSKWQDHGRLAVQQAMGERTPLMGALSCHVDIVLPVPASLSQKKRYLALTGVIYPTVKPDCDNFLKSALDICSTIAFVDDKQVVKATVMKQYGERPRMEITINEIGEAAKPLMNRATGELFPARKE